jgi:hypothetical protein
MMLSAIIMAATMATAPAVPAQVLEDAWTTGMTTRTRPVVERTARPAPTVKPAHKPLQMSFQGNKIKVL